MMTVVERIVKERNEALFSLDRKKIERYLKKYGQAEFTKAPENIFWAGVYKAICEINDAPPELVEKASSWLIDNNFKIGLQQ